MKRIFAYLITGSFVLILSFLTSCKKEALKVAPTVTIAEATNITANSASVSSTITADGGSEILSRGVCWNISGNPTISDSKTTDGKGLGSYTSSLTSLSPGTTYNLKSYATNAIGTAYSNQASFKTLALLATLTTSEASAIASTTFSSGGNITNDGGASITARGVCWSTSQNPTITDSKTTDGTGSGIFTSSITGLTPGSTYYFRAYATNSIGTVYGNQVTTTTSAIIPTITTAVITDITTTTATSGGNITSDGGAAVTVRGVCWSTSQSPTISDSKTTNGTNTGSFTSSLVNLNLGTTYYVRAYATNSAGTGYGSTVSFTTAFNDILFNPNKTYGSVTDVEGNVYKTISIGTQTWTAENLRTTKYRNGDLIGTTNPITLDISTLSDKRFQWAYDGDESLVPTYGRLYTWFTVTDSRGVCPNGWHVATNGEWTLLINYLGGESVAGGKLKETSTRHWADPNTGATNESGFTALPGGYRDYWGAYYLMGFYGEWWSSTEYNTSNAWYEYFNNDYSKIVREYRVLKHYGGSVRCVSGELTQPTLSTNSISSITSTSAVSGGNITSDGGSSVTASGICWSTSPTPIITSNKSTDGSSAGSFTSSLTGLSPNTTYYVRAYATNGLGTVYGSQVSFTTNSTAVIPIVSTTSISFITGTTASSGGAISNDGGSAVTARGVCWSTAQNPAITDSKTADGSGTGNFTSSLSGLSLGTTYYARAYATNSAGTAYGNSITFTTSSTQIQLPTISTIAVTSSSWDSGASGGIITSDGGATVTVRGVCWSNSPSPTISGNKTTDGSGTGSFSSSFNGLLKWWRYYVRAYATNIVGTAYGNEISFTTMIPPLQFSTSKTYGSLTDADGNVYKTIQIGSQTWMAENLRATKYSDGTSIPEGEAFNNEWSSLVSPGYSWLYWNDETFKSVYGALYNWYTVNTSKLCPTGWHVPNDTEWKTLTNLLGGESIAGGKLKEMGTNHWDTPNTGATNETGFTAIPGGNIYSNGSGMNIGSLGGWWSSTLSNTTNAWSRLLYNTDGIVHSLSYDKRYGFSVRCLKD